MLINFKENKNFQKTGKSPFSCKQFQLTNRNTKFTPKYRRMEAQKG